jgi:hypothetical protein
VRQSALSIGHPATGGRKHRHGTSGMRISFNTFSNCLQKRMPPLVQVLQFLADASDAPNRPKPRFQRRKHGKNSVRHFAMRRIERPSVTTNTAVRMNAEERNGK